MKRLAALSSGLLLMSLAFAAPVFAAAPGNDTYAGRTVITGLPFSDTVDTSEATTDADDDELNAQCGAPATDASVWYEFTADAEEVLIADASASDYSVGLFVATGTPGSFNLIDCAAFNSVFFVFPGETYTIVAFDFQGDGGGNGGTLEFSLDAAPPPPEIAITVDPTGKFDRVTGSATISGTVTCSADAEFAFVDVAVQQKVGRFAIRGFGGTEIFCDGTTQPWSVEVVADNGLFKGGRTTTVTFGVACNFFCNEDVKETTVLLTG